MSTNLDSGMYMRPYWQCHDCLYVVKERRFETWKDPCPNCSSPESKRGPWLGTIGDHYGTISRELVPKHAGDLGLASVILCGYAEFLLETVLWLILFRQDCPKEHATIIMKRSSGAARKIDLFKELIAISLKDAIDGLGNSTFYDSWAQVRLYRNSFAHGRPHVQEDASDTTYEEIDEHLKRVGMELEEVFQGLSNRYVAQQDRLQG